MGIACLTCLENEHHYDFNIIMYFTLISYQFPRQLYGLLSSNFLLMGALATEEVHHAKNQNTLQLAMVFNQKTLPSILQTSG